MSDRALRCPLCTISSTGTASPYRAPEKTTQRIALEPHDYEAGISVQRCQECDGIWLEEGQLSQIQDARVNDYSHVHAGDVVLRHRSAHAGEEREPPMCPRCDEAMFASTFKTSNIPYASCLSCGGQWLREGALQDIEAFWESLITT